MQVTVEMVQARRDQLQREFEVLRNNLQATSGAIQDCDYWLGKIAEENKDGQE